jgi:DNA-binding XRE family transcriptional regulator
MPTIKELRKDHFLSQLNLADKAKLTRTTVNRLELGKHKPNSKTVRALAKALGVKPEDIEF